MTTTTANFPGTIDATTTGGSTNAWTNPNNVKATDGSYASQISGGYADNRVLRATNFGFTLPPTVISIDGITLTVLRRRSGGTQGEIYDDLIHLLVADTVVGANRSAITAWSTTAGGQVYGGPADNWGQTLTYADINNTGFGMRIRTYAALPSDRSADIDSITLQVTYTDVAGITGDYFWQGSVANR